MVIVTLLVKEEEGWNDLFACVVLLQLYEGAVVEEENLAKVEITTVVGQQA